jgi:hypothetical protein
MYEKKEVTVNQGRSGRETDARINSIATLLSKRGRGRTEGRSNASERNGAGGDRRSSGQGIMEKTEGTMADNRQNRRTSRGKFEDLSILSYSSCVLCSQKGQSDQFRYLYSSRQITSHLARLHSY